MEHSIQLVAFAVAFALEGLLHLGATPLHAQEKRQAGVAQPSDSQARLSELPVDVSRHVVRFERTLAGMGGEVLGLFIGGTAAYATAGKCERYSCDYHGLYQSVLGALAGGMIGTAVFAAAPKGSGNCTRGHRFRRAFAGATTGAVAGVAIVAVGSSTKSNPVTFGATLLALLAPPVGAAIALRPC